MNLPFGSWFGRITFREVVRPNYLLGGGSGKLQVGKWFGRITLGEVVGRNYFWGGDSGNYSPGGGPGKLLPRW